jgi:hypothetical protein
MLDADDLWELFEIVWQTPVFRERLANFEYVTLTQGILKVRTQARRCAALLA